jgi:hypothetical protein
MGDGVRLDGDWDGGLELTEVETGAAGGMAGVEAVAAGVVRSEGEMAGGETAWVVIPEASDKSRNSTGDKVKTGRKEAKANRPMQKQKQKAKEPAYLKGR